MNLRELAAMRPGRRQEVLARGEPPDLAALAGWEYRGVNVPAPLPTLLGIRRFLKGFLGEVGYNQQIVGTHLDQPWTVRPQRDGRERYAFFAVRPAENAVLFDYGAVPDLEPGIAARLRDHVVRVEPGSDDHLLGRAFLAAGRHRIPVGWFVLERAAPIEP